MYLTRIKINNFKCYESVELEKVGRLAVIIGENDVGKTVMLDAISLLLQNQTCNQEDYRKMPDCSLAEEIFLEGEFQLESHDTLPFEFRSGAANDKLLLRKKFNQKSVEVRIVGLGYSDSRFDDFSGADNQKQLLREFGKKPASREEERKAQREELVVEGKLQRVQKEFNINFALLLPHLPRVERISSADYRSPDSMIQRTLQSVAASVIAPIDHQSGAPKEIKTLSRVREQIQKRLDAEIVKAKSTLSKIHPKLKTLSVNPTIDFTRAVTATNLSIDVGDGDRLLSSFGEGTKKRFWMGLLDWEREATRDSVTTSVIRLYDEPDVNLHYEAQRQLFNNISNLTREIALRTQAFVCTHSVTFVDRAPYSSINLIKVDDDFIRSLSRIKTEDNGEIIDFVNDIGRAVGLSNTVLIYERCFIVVEGPSEEVALPLIYKYLYKRTLLEDGIVMINLHTCSAWKSILKLLLSNRKEMTLFLLDSDCKIPGSSGYITDEQLASLGCTVNFHDKNIEYIGAKEFEDAFSDKVIAKALNVDFPLENGKNWKQSDITKIRSTTVKFSDDLQKIVITSCVKAMRTNAKKPNIAESISRQCNSKTSIPTEIIRLFEKARKISGVN